ncbi:hypothetical protein HDV00_009237 [Rhizophlyctis rosea]|nr:hypothetical protein HDV00_009237 [Rhizophlyctis rosea]
MKANVTFGTTLSNNVIIGTKCTTQRDEHVPSDTVIFGQGHSRRIQTKSTRTQQNLHSRHLEYLREVLPKYHHLKGVGK